MVRLSVTDDGLTSPLATAQCVVTARPTARLTGDTLVCDGASATLTVTFTGLAPWHLTYTRDTTRQQIIVSTSPYTFQTDSAGVYRLVTLTDASGCAASALPDSVLVQRCSPVVLAYPNPSAGILQLGSGPHTQPGTATVWNMQGQVMWQRTLAGPEFGTALAIPLPDGLYLLEVTIAGRTTRQKISVSR
jgi:hypothetical protein